MRERDQGTRDKGGSLQQGWVWGSGGRGNAQVMTRASFERKQRWGSGLWWGRSGVGVMVVVNVRVRMELSKLRLGWYRTSTKFCLEIK